MDTPVKPDASKFIKPDASKVDASKIATTKAPFTPGTTKPPFSPSSR